jgi:hypothetical protein
MKIILLIIILFLTSKSSFGQEFTDLYGDYLGQTVPGDTPMVFASGIISKNSLEHSAAIFSPDGNEIYWASRENQESILNIWLMSRINNRWLKPEIFKPLGDSVNLFDPFLSADGKKVYFGADNNENADVWVVNKQGNDYTNPQSIDSTINTINGECQATLTIDNTVYFLEYKWKDNRFTCDIVRSKFENGIYLQPEILPVCINSPSQDWTPYIAQDDSYLIFTSNRKNNQMDLYISFHDIPSDTWSEPINMGEPINTGTQESFPTVSPDGNYLFFTRYNQDTKMDIFWVSAKIIDRLREQNDNKE